MSDFVNENNGNTYYPQPAGYYCYGCGQWVTGIHLCYPQNVNAGSYLELQRIRVLLEKLVELHTKSEPVAGDTTPPAGTQ